MPNSWNDDIAFNKFFWHAKEASFNAHHKKHKVQWASLYLYEDRWNQKLLRGDKQIRESYSVIHISETSKNE